MYSNSRLEQEIGVFQNECLREKRQKSRWSDRFVQRLNYIEEGVVKVVQGCKKYMIRGNCLSEKWFNYELNEVKCKKGNTFIAYYVAQQ